ncbi:MAG: 16S rRNA (guanine(966)-N(2))-methyltransferase RsmD [Lachnospiraceae bacterium]
MRIIGGKCRSLPLKTPKGLQTRPTTDRIKETLFNIIHSELPGSRFLDLFAGSGGIGMEAISRGADWAVFVEKNKDAIRCIEENLKFTGLHTQARLLKMDVLTAIQQLNGQESFDIIFMDPPYGMQLEKQVLIKLKGTSLMAGHTLIIVETDLTTDYTYLDELGYEMIRYKKYKTNAHVFIRPKKITI